MLVADSAVAAGAGLLSLKRSSLEPVIFLSFSPNLPRPPELRVVLFFVVWLVTGGGGTFLLGFGGILNELTYSKKIRGEKPLCASRFKLGAPWLPG